ncbi:hypothetical protein [Hwangdonia sp.]|uniref:hypothetical protein n=1 Tax=Hwangdonia sp. TaxID=1883432 RepID=UPI003AB682FD
MLFNNRLPKKFIEAFFNDLEEESFEKAIDDPLNNPDALNFLQKLVKDFGVINPSRDRISIVKDLEQEVNSRIKKLQFYNKCNTETAIVLLLATPKNKELLSLLAFLKNINLALGEND